MSDILTRLKQYVADESGWQDADALIIEAIVNIEQMRDGLIEIIQMDKWPIEPGDYGGKQYVGSIGKYANTVLNKSRGIVNEIGSLQRKAHRGHDA